MWTSENASTSTSFVTRQCHDVSGGRATYWRDPPFILACRVEILAGQLNGHHLHHPSSVAETHHHHFASYPYHRLLISRASSFGRERQHGPPPLAVHKYPPLRSHPDSAPYGANLADHPLRAGEGRPTFERAQGAQDAKEHAPHSHREDHDGTEGAPRAWDTPTPEERQ